ncbi:hypothetical protein [Pararhodobacter oceanensis]|uniref:hypothetical protein n=1 Tax=Pararhodobacter oceanensis TaxID=2172121 RepID=UPI003A8EB4FA
MPAIRVSPDQLEDLLVVGGMSSDDLKAVASRLLSVDEVVIAASKIREIVVDSGVDSAVATSLVRQAIALAAYCRASGRSPEDTLSGLIKGIVSSGASNKERLADKLTLLKAELSAIISDASIRQSAKALHLSFEHEKIYHASRLIVDIRPVINDEREATIGAVIHASFRLDYFAEGERHSVSVAVDTSDLDEMIANLEDCKKKLSVSKELFEVKLKQQAFLAGEETYGFD